MKNKKGIGLITLVVIIAVLLVIGAVITILVVKNNTPKDENIINENTAENSNAISDNNINKENISKQEDNYTNVQHIASNKFYINYKEGRAPLEKYVSYVFRGIDDIVQLVYNRETFNGTLKEIFDLVDIPTALYDIDRIFTADFGGTNAYSIVREKEETIKINGIDTLKFEGFILDRQNKKVAVYGYAFIINEKPNLLIGYVNEVDNKETLKTEIIKEVDTMMKTVRTER